MTVLNMERKEEVLKKLKPKVASFGFSREEVKSIAALVADNLSLEEEATEEEVNEAIESGISSVLPFLRIGQQMTSRVVNAAKKEKKADDDVADDVTKNSSKGDSEEPVKEDVAPAWAQALIKQNESLANEIAAIKAGKVSDGRKSKLEKLLKDTGAYGKRTLKNFSLMSFKDDDAFEDFYSEVEQDLKEYNQERSNAGLAKLGAPGIGGGSAAKKDEPEKLSDADVEALAATM